MPDLPLRIVDGLTLGPEYRAVLRPHGLVRDRARRLRRLPRFFYEIPGWEVAQSIELTPHFLLWEFINVDVRETELLRSAWPRYVPCVVPLLAAYLELFREQVGTYVHIAANGAYRSPSHRLAGQASTHCWGTAVNIYRIGDDWLDDERNITRYTRVAERIMPGVRALPWGHDIGETDDHLHLDLGYTVMVPPDSPGEDPGTEGDDVDEASS